MESVEQLNLFMVPQQAEVRAILPENAEEQTLLDLLSYEGRHVDDLIRESQLSATSVSATLVMMELKGMIKHIGGMQYVLAR
jgi:DNA processing protein